MVYKKFTGDNTAYTSIHDRQPMFMKEGQMITNGSGEPAARFSNSYVQLPIRAQSRHGIRICLYMQMDQTLSDGFIFSYGHRQKDEITLTCEHNPALILVKTGSSRYPGWNRVIRLPITESMRQEPFKLEVALYGGGQLAVAVNEWLTDSAVVPHSFSIYDGKLMIGSHLDGQKTGTFLNSAITVEAIDKRYRLSHMFKGGLMKIGNFPLQDLPPNVLKRPAIVR